MTAPSSRAARRRDRTVYLRSHPVLFALLAVTRRRPVVRIGRTVLVHDPAAYREVLTRVPLDRTAAGTTGGAAAGLTDGGLLFDQDGAGHRAARRGLAADLNSTAVARLRPLWQTVLAARIDPLRHGGTLDLVPLATELAGLTTAALTGSTADPLTLAGAAADAAAATARDHLPGPRRPGSSAAPSAAPDRLTALLPDSLDAMLAVAAVNTTVAALPRAAAWCADTGLWHRLAPGTSPGPAAGPAVEPAVEPATELATELLRLTAASPILPRVAAADSSVAGCPIARGDRLVLVARHAAESYRDTPADRAAAAQAVFGAGPHACPGAGLARALLADFLVALAPHHPVVVRARADRRAALPGWAELHIARGEAPRCG